MEHSNDNRKVSKRSRPLSQKDALQTIYHCLGGEKWTRKDNWLSSTHEEDLSKWSGVTCNSTGQVTAIELSQNNLQGRLGDDSIMEALGVFAPFLEQLWLSENALTGNLPIALADRSKFPALTILDVGNNQLSGCLPPSFTRAKHFSWFDMSGNQLTSYFRYEKSADASNNNNNNETIKSSSPLSGVHTVVSLLEKSQSQKLIDLALDYTQQSGGWQMDRHKDYRTTDIDVAIVGGDLLELCNGHLKDSILPALSQLFGFPAEDLAIEDLFLAKYSASKGEQNSLTQHRDGSELSFVITLNEAFQGGGTKFVEENITVAPKEAGTGVLFCGRKLHAGVEVVEGTRYILAGFVRVYPSTAVTVSKLESLVQ